MIENTVYLLVICRIENLGSFTILIRIMIRLHVSKLGCLIHIIEVPAAKDEVKLSSSSGSSTIF